MEFDELWMEQEVLRIHMAQVRGDERGHNCNVFRR